MDRDLVELNRRLKMMEEQMAQVELQVLKQDVLFETEQTLEHRRNEMKFAEIGNAFHVCESVNESLLEKVAHQQEIIEKLKVEMEAVKGLFVNVQKSLCELGNRLEQQTESKAEMSALKELVANLEKAQCKLGNQMEQQMGSKTEMSELKELVANLQEAQRELGNKLERRVTFKDPIRDTKNLIHETASSKPIFGKKTEETISHLQRGNSLDKDALSKSHPEPKAELEQVVQSAAQINVFNPKADFVWKIPNVMNRISRGNSDSSQCFSVRGYPFTFQGFISFKGDDFLLCIFFIPDAVLKTLAPRRLRIPSVHLALINQIGDRRPDLVRSGNFCFGTKFNAMQFIFHESLIDNSPYTRNDSVTVEIHVEPPAMAKQVYSRDGTLRWTINNYERYRDLETAELRQFQLSPYFYTSTRGYRVQAAAYLNGEGSFKGDGVSVRITFLLGEFDEELSPSFSHSTSITMIAKSDPKTSHHNVVHKYDIGKDKSSYVIHLWSHCLVETTLVNDSLILEIAIKE